MSIHGEEKPVLSSTIESSDRLQIAARQTNFISWESSHAGFQSMCETFEQARLEHREETVESLYRLAGKIVLVRIVGRALAATYQRAFAPCAIAMPTGLAPALTIDLWDEGVTGLPYPLLIATNQGNRPHIGERQVQYNDESGRWVWGEKVGTASWLDRKANRIVGWRAQGAQSPTYERSKPLGFLLPMWFYDQNIHILHAGVVAREGAGVLITGGHGIGKTTTTLCCMLGGFDYLSDDQIAVEQAKGGEGASAFVAHSIFQSARVLPDHLQRFPALSPHAIPSHDPHDFKSLLFMAEAFPDRVAAQATIRVITLPRLPGQAQAQTRYQRATRADALNYMARTSLMMPLGIGRARFEQLTHLLGSAPCYWLDLGYDLTLIPPTIQELLTEVL